MENLNIKIPLGSDVFEQINFLRLRFHQDKEKDCFQLEYVDRLYLTKLLDSINLSVENKLQSLEGTFSEFQNILENSKGRQL